MFFNLILFRIVFQSVGLKKKIQIIQSDKFKYICLYFVFCFSPWRVFPCRLWPTPIVSHLSRLCICLFICLFCFGKLFAKLILCKHAAKIQQHDNLIGRDMWPAFDWKATLTAAATAAPAQSQQKFWLILSSRVANAPAHLPAEASPPAPPYSAIARIYFQQMNVHLNVSCRDYWVCTVCMCVCLRLTHSTPLIDAKRMACGKNVASNNCSCCCVFILKSN